MIKVDFTVYDNYEEFERGGKQKIKKNNKPKIKMNKEHVSKKSKIRKKNNQKRMY